MRAYDQATVNCSIKQTGTASSITGVIGAAETLLSGRTCTPLWPFQDPAQEGEINSYRGVFETFLFPSDSDDWSDNLSGVGEGMILVVTGTGTEYLIERADAWQPPAVVASLFPLPVLHLIVKRVKVAA
jgi:hypothetical protein